MKTRNIIAIAALALLASASLAQATEFSLPSAADAWILKGNNTPQGGANVAVMRNDIYGVYQNLLQFDLSSIPSGTAIDKAQFVITEMLGEGAGMPCGWTAEIYRVTAPWVEAEVTWNYMSSGSPWTAPGGDYVGTTGLPDVDPYASVSYPYVNWVAGQKLPFDIKNLVNEWMAGTPNYGLLIKVRADGNIHNNEYFEMKETPTAGYAPVLQVNMPHVSLPWPSSVSGHVTMLDYSAASTSVGVVVDFTQGDTVVSKGAFLDADGNFSIPLQDGTYDSISIKAAASLRKTLPGRVISGDVNIGNVDLINGDLDGDNEVTSTDLSILGLNLGLTGD